MTSLSQFVIISVIFLAIMRGKVLRDLKESPPESEPTADTDTPPSAVVKSNLKRHMKDIEACSPRWQKKRRRLDFEAAASTSSESLNADYQDLPLLEKATTFQNETLQNVSTDIVDPIPSVTGCSALFPCQSNSNSGEVQHSDPEPSGTTVPVPVLVEEMAAMAFPDLLSFFDTCEEFDIDVLSLIDAVDLQCDIDIDPHFDPSCLFTAENPDDKYLADFDAESSSDEEDSLNNSFPKKVTDALRLWTLSKQVPHSTVDSLLSSLREIPELKNLPATAPTLVKTRRGKIKPVDVPGGGQYYHFGIALHLLSILSNVVGCHLKLFVNIDGIGIFKSKGSELWPILCRIVNQADLSHIVFPVGFYYANFKPKSPMFLQTFADEAEKLIKNGLKVNDQFFSISVDALICDAPAKALALGILSFNGKFSCTRCHAEGMWSGTRKRMYFPDEDKAPRTHEEFMLQSDKKHHKFTSPLIKISTLIFPASVCLDYLHLILLGVFRTMVYLWLIGKRPFKIGPQQRKKISARMANLKFFAPKEFARKPRPTEEICYFKGTEWRQLLLYTGMTVFLNQVDANKYKNFLYLSVATRIILDPENKENKELISFARGLFLYFIQTFREEYDDDFITHNFHALIHICDDLQTFGSLEEVSAFPFENFMQYLKKLIRKSSDVLVQLARRMLELLDNQLLHAQVKRRTFFKNVEYFQPHTQGPLAEGTTSPQFSCLKIKFLELSTNDADNCCTLKNGAVVRISNICRDQRTQKMVIVGHCFTEKSDFFLDPCESSELGIYRVSKLAQSLRSWPVDMIATKNYLMPINNAMVVVPLLDSTFQQ